MFPLIKEGLNTCYDLTGSFERLREVIDPLAQENEITFDYSLMYNYGITDMF